MITPCEPASAAAREVMRPLALQRQLKPPRFAALPVKRATRSIVLSGTFHGFALAVVIWIPGHVPIPVVVDRPAEEMKLRDNTPITFTALSPIKSLQAKLDPVPKPAHRSPTLTKSVAAVATAKRDYAGPLEIVSLVPHATNRVQTILRPDIASPPSIKFPLRLQSMVMLKAPTSPEVAKDALRPKLQVPTPPRVEIPVMTRTVARPELTLMPVKEVPVQPEPAPAASGNAPPTVAKPQAEKGPGVVDLGGSAKKSAIVVNAVDVTPDPHVQIPDAQLAGRFVVGPAVKAAVPELAPDAKVTAKSAGGSTTTREDLPATPAPALASRPGDNHAGSSNAGTSGPANGGGGSSDRAKGAGTGITISAGGTAPGGSGSGITIAGGGSTPNGNSGTRINAVRRTYGLTVTGAGGSGGAGRDMGVFGRSEIVYSVAIPMSDVGCSSDWPMQYALLNSRPRGAGLLEPPVATKKFAAIVDAKDMVRQSTPVFVRGVIDEKGKLIGLQSIVAQDPRAEVAMRSLEKWEFLPAVLDGTAVPTKVLIGVVVVSAEK
jgi:hypothetical protein